MTLVRVYCGLASADSTAVAPEAQRWLTVAVVDDSGRLLDICEVSDDAGGYAELCGLLTQRGDGPGGVTIATDNQGRVVTQLLVTAGRYLAYVHDDRITDDYAERFADEDSADELASGRAERRAVGLARALQAGALYAVPQPPADDLISLKPLLNAHGAMVSGRQQAAGTLREVLRELYPAALRAYADPAEPMSLAVLEALPEAGFLGGGVNGRSRETQIVTELYDAGVAEKAALAEAVTALRLAVAETPRRQGVTRAMTSAVAETVRQAVSAVRCCDAATEALVRVISDRMASRPGTSTGPGAPVPIGLSAPVPAGMSAPGRPEPVAPPAPAVVPPVPSAPLRVISEPVPAERATPVRAERPEPVRADDGRTGAGRRSRSAAATGPDTGSIPAARAASPAETSLAGVSAGIPAATTGLPTRDPATGRFAPAVPPAAPPVAVPPVAAPPAVTPPAAAAVVPPPPAAGLAPPSAVMASPNVPPARPVTAPTAIPPSSRQSRSTIPPRQATPPPPVPSEYEPPRSMPAPPVADPSSTLTYATLPPPIAYNPLPADEAGPVPVDGQATGAPAPRLSPDVPAPGSRSTWPLTGDPDDAEPEADRPAGTGAAEVPRIDLPRQREGRVMPPWQSDDLPAEPPTLRLVEPAPLADPALSLERPAVDDLGADLRYDPPALRLVESDHDELQSFRAQSFPESIADAPVESGSDDSDLLIFAACRSAWFVDPSESEEQLEWATPADSGWEAAEQAARPAVGADTGAGLPRRVPQQNLVPGSPMPQQEIERPLRIVRDAASIAAHTSGYFRGYRRGQEVGGYAVGGRPGRESAGGWDFSRDASGGDGDLGEYEYRSARR